MKKILVLDDSPFMLALISDILTGLHYDVTTADNGKEACQKIENSRFDLIITDMNMPNMDGLEFTQQARTMSNCKYVPILMLSSEEDREKIAAAKKMGVSTFLSKPPQKSQLQNIMQVILNKRGSVRVHAQFKVTWGDDSQYSGVSYDVSTGGLFVETPALRSLGETFPINLYLPGDSVPLVCPVKVAWVFTKDKAGSDDRPAGMGLEFLDQTPQKQISDFLKNIK